MTSPLVQNYNELLALIQSMSATQKAYFKKLAKRYANEKPSLHMRLYEQMIVQPEADDKYWMNHIGVKAPNQFSNIKSRLFQEILDALCFLSKENDVRTHISNLTTQVEILQQKRLFNSAHKLLLKAKNLCMDYGSYLQLWQLMRLEYQMILQQNHRNKKELLEKVEAELDYYSDQLAEIGRLERLKRKTGLLKSLTYLRTTEQDRSEPIQLLQQALDQKVPPGSLPYVHILYHTSVSILAYLAAEHDTCIQHVHILLNLWKKNKELITAYPATFLEGASHVFYAYFIDFVPLRMAQVYEEISVLVETQIKDSNQLAFWEITKFNTRLKVFHKTFDYQKVETLLEEQAPRILHLCQHRIPLSESLPVMSSICISYFVLGRYQEAEDLLQQIIEYNRIVKRDDFFYFAQIFHLVILTELKDWYRLHLAVSAAYHQVYKKDKARPFEKELMLQLKRLPDMIQSNQSNAYFEKVLGILDQYRNDPVKKLHLLYFNFYGWLESKKLRITYREYVERFVTKDMAQ